MILARNSSGGFYECKKDWPTEDCFIQCGGDGVVFTQHSMEEVLTDPLKQIGAITGVLSEEKSPLELPYYRTAFFEAFPRNPNTFIRGEGKTVEEAEADCWNQYQKYFECDHPSFEPRDYTNGAGHCTKCGLWFPSVIDPIHPCKVCGEKTWFSRDKDGDYWCEKCYEEMPIEKMTELQKMMLEK